MAYVQPSPPRFAIEQTSESLTVTVPGRKNWPVLLFTLCWLGGWAGGEAMAVKSIASGKGSAFLFIWLVGWTLGGCFAALSALYMAVGRETITVARFPERLTVQRKLLGRAFWTWEFDLSQIRRLRVRPPQVGRQRASAFGPTNIAFDYGAQTEHIGAGLDDAEAQIIIDALQAWYPALRS